MKIVQLVPRMELGGVERGVVDLSSALVTAGAESVVVSAGGALVAVQEGQGGRHIAFDIGSKNILTAPQRAWRLRQILQQQQPDVVHVRSRAPSWLLRLSGARVGHAPFKIVSTLHGLYSVNAYSAQMTKADAVICPSRAARDYAQTHYHVPEDKLRLIPRGINFDEFTANEKNDCRAALRGQWQVGASDFLIALVGRVSPLKGHALFIEALAKVVANNSGRAGNIIGIIVGGGSDKRTQALQAAANAHGIGAQVRLVGVQRNMAAVYRAVDLLVSASQKPESFGRTMAEALAMNCPVVAASHGGALDIIQDGSNGFLFPPQDSLACAAAVQKAIDKTQQQQWTNLRASVSQFSLAAMTSQTLAVYQELCGTPPNPTMLRNLQKPAPCRLT